MSQKRQCDICGRLYKLIPIETRGFDEWAIGWDTSHIRVRVRESNSTKLYDYDICRRCSKRMVKYVSTMRRDAPKKCEFCEHDYGPKHPDHLKNCEGCTSKYEKFQLKERMSERMKYEWDLYNGEV